MRPNPNNRAIKHALTVSPHLPSPLSALAKYCNCSPYCTVRVFKIDAVIRKPFRRWAGIPRQTQTRKT